MKFLLLLLFAVPAFAQTVTYDKFGDNTSVRTESVRTPVFMNGSLFMATSCLHKGITLADIDDLHCSLVFRSSSRSWQFLKSRELIFLADNERINLGEGSHDGDVSRSRYSSGVTERMTYKVSRSDLEKLAKASLVEIKLGYAVGRLDPKDLKGIKDVLAYK